MRFTHYLYILPLTLLAACSSEKLEQSQPATDHPNGPIQLTAGIVEGGSAAVTRAGAENYHASHTTLKTNTKLALQVSGKWKKTADGTAESVIKPTTASIGAETADGSKHNSVVFTGTNVLYWDDYGTADPNNATQGRAEGLTIFGVAIDGKTDAAPTVSDWTALTWTVPENQTTTGNIPADKDLLISNNVQPSPGASTSNDGTYKFDERSSGKLLEFRHALSKITVNVTAGTGFDAITTHEVILTSNDGTGTTVTEWPYTSGKVNITTGAVTDQAGSAAITMNDAETTQGYTFTTEALVIPGSEFTSDNAIIARINANGNNYYVTAKAIRDKISGMGLKTGEEYLTLPGKNYIINVVLNKTEINVTATVTNWVDVEAAEVSPVINVIGNLGGSAGSFDSDFNFSFYRSTDLNSGYSSSTPLTSPLTENSFYKSEGIVTYTKSTNKWAMTTDGTTETHLYWPDHNTHYQFRGVWPLTVTTVGDGVLISPRVELVGGNQVIKVKNEAYTKGKFPSDLMIARPDVENAAENCGNNETGHDKKNLYTEGICAREGNINLTFNYMMSQVEVNLSTSADTDPDKVELTGAVVELVNVYSTGNVNLGDRGVIPTGNTGVYPLDAVTEETNKWLSAIVPQELTYTTTQAESNVRFRITITNSDSSKDVYYADVEPILKTDKSGKVTPNGKWESGYHYVYDLKLTKTAVQVTATLADWKTVTASEEVWF